MLHVITRLICIEGAECLTIRAIRSDGFSASRSVECCYPIVVCISLGDLYCDIEGADGLTIRSICTDR